jgi:hypothetical protein
MKMHQRIPNGTSVQIIKPIGNMRDWPLGQRDVYWAPGMDSYIGKIYTVRAYNHIRRSYRLEEILYSWHEDWLIVPSKDRNGNFEPYDNEGRIKCFWCKGPLNSTRERSANGLLVFKYCPKCSR